MIDDVHLRRASAAEIDEIMSIDDDACTRYDNAGLHIGRGPDHPVSQAERVRWTEAARNGWIFLAGARAARPVGLLVMGRVDGQAFLDQLSVRMADQGRGLGRRLLQQAIAWAGAEPLWLTTYAHVPWNRPFYERHGFAVVPPSQCSPGLVTILDEERVHLPDPHQRIAMCRPAIP